MGNESDYGNSGIVRMPNKRVPRSLLDGVSTPLPEMDYSAQPAQKPAAKPLLPGQQEPPESLKPWSASQIRSGIGAVASAVGKGFHDTFVDPPYNAGKPVPGQTETGLLPGHENNIWAPSKPVPAPLLPTADAAAQASPVQKPAPAPLLPAPTPTNNPPDSNLASAEEEERKAATARSLSPMAPSPTPSAPIAKRVAKPLLAPPPPPPAADAGERYNQALGKAKSLFGNGVLQASPEEKSTLARMRHEGTPGSYGTRDMNRQAAGETGTRLAARQNDLFGRQQADEQIARQRGVIKEQYAGQAGVESEKNKGTLGVAQEHGAAEVGSASEKARGEIGAATERAKGEVANLEAVRAFHREQKDADRQVTVQKNAQNHIARMQEISQRTTDASAKQKIAAWQGVVGKVAASGVVGNYGPALFANAKAAIQADADPQSVHAELATYLETRAYELGAKTPEDARAIASELYKAEGNEHALPANIVAMLKK